MAPSRAKPVTRRTALSRRDALTPEDRARASAAIASRALAALADVAPGATVALYAPTGSEVDTAALDTGLRALGARVVYPRVVPGQVRLDFHVATTGELVSARFGLREPDPTRARAIELAAIDAFIVPIVAFDRAGSRVGWGRGHYDATLAAAAPAAVRLGIAFECQRADHVPTEPHDVRLHRILTEAGVYPE